MQEERLELEPSVGFSGMLDWPAGSGARYLLSTMLACTSALAKCTLPLRFA